jgi:hypothetical protein
MTDKERIAELERRIAELEAERKPARPAELRQRFDPTEGMRMPASAEAATAGVDVRALVRDFRHGVPQPSGLLGPQPAGPSARGTGWAEPAPLRQPPGIEIIDRMCGAKK